MLTIRHEEARDIPAVAAVHVRAWQIGYAGILPADVLATLDPAEFARRRRERLAADIPLTTLVADLDGTVVGFATVGPYRNRQNSADLDPAYGEIWAIYVAPDAWGGGIGSALLDRACAELARRGLPEARLWVLADNVRARRFYEHHGLFPDGERSTYPVRRAPDQPPVQLPEVRYARRLDQ